MPYKNKGILLNIIIYSQEHYHTLQNTIQILC